MSTPTMISISLDTFAKHMKDSNARNFVMNNGNVIGFKNGLPGVRVHQAQNNPTTVAVIKILATTITTYHNPVGVNGSSVDPFGKNGIDAVISALALLSIDSAIETEIVPKILKNNPNDVITYVDPFGNRHRFVVGFSNITYTQTTLGEKVGEPDKKYVVTRKQVIDGSAANPFEKAYNFNMLLVVGELIKSAKRGEIVNKCVKINKDYLTFRIRNFYIDANTGNLVQVLPESVNGIGFPIQHQTQITYPGQQGVVIPTSGYQQQTGFGNTY